MKKTIKSKTSGILAVFLILGSICGIPLAIAQEPGYYITVYYLKLGNHHDGNIIQYVHQDHFSGYLTH